MGNKKGLLKSILPWLIVLMVISVAIPFFNQSESSEIRYDKFIEIVQKEKVKDVEIVPKSLVIDVSGTYSKKASNGKKQNSFCKNWKKHAHELPETKRSSGNAEFD